MKFILEFITVVIVGILPNLLGALFHLRSADYARKAGQFSALEMLPNMWLGAMSSTSVVLLVAYQQPDGFASIGIRSGQWVRNMGDVILGVLGISLFIILFNIGQKIILSITKQTPDLTVDASNPLIIDSLRYKDIWERLANLAVLPFSAIAEDLIYRGYLVLFLGKLTNTYIPWAFISIALMVLLHLYQGRNLRNIVFHILIASFFTYLAITTQNILAPITAHIYLNLASRIKLWSLAKNQNERSSIVENSDIKKLAYALFTVINIFILIVGSVIVLI